MSAPAPAGVSIAVFNLKCLNLKGKILGTPSLAVARW